MKKAGVKTALLLAGAFFVSAVAALDARAEQAQDVEVLLDGCTLTAGQLEDIKLTVLAVKDIFVTELEGRGRVVENPVIKILGKEEYAACRARLPHITCGSNFYIFETHEVVIPYVEGREWPLMRADIFHEVGHAFTQKYLSRRLPDWLSEGLAWYFSRTHGAPGSVTVAPGGSNFMAKEWLETNTARDLVRDILPGGKWNSNSKRDFWFYALPQWSLAYFLMETPRSRGILLDFVDKINSGRPSVRALDLVYPGGAQGLARDWAAWVALPQKSHHYGRPDPAAHVDKAGSSVTTRFYHRVEPQTPPPGPVETAVRVVNSLSGIVYSPEGAAVLINDDIGRVGDEVFGGKIVEITPDSVIVQFADERREYHTGEVLP